MKSLRNYASYRAQEPKFEQPPMPDSANLNHDNVQAYLNMSQDERWSLLLKKVAQSRASGNMTDGDLDRMAQSAQALLSPAQYADMLRMVDVLKQGSTVDEP